MRLGLAALAGLGAVLAAGCAASSPGPQISEPSSPPASVEAPPPASTPLAETTPAPSPSPTAASTPARPRWSLACTSEAVQGGAVICRADPKEVLALDGKDIAAADEDGIAIIGLSRNQKATATISYSPRILSLMPPGSQPMTATVKVAARKDDVSTLEMECNKIAPQTEAEKKAAEVAWLKKDAALKTFAPPRAPVAMVKPVVATEQQYSISSFGRTRYYKPKTKDCEGTTNIHNGTDIAVPTGTEIRAPMAGTVMLADPNLYFEGGAVFLDLGRGLVSVTMHMSRIDVKTGDIVRQGDLLGLSGATGRVTGPHVHWAIKFRNVLETERDGDIWLDPMLLLKLDQAALPAG